MTSAVCRSVSQLFACFDLVWCNCDCCPSWGNPVLLMGGKNARPTDPHPFVGLQAGGRGAGSPEAAAREGGGRRQAEEDGGGPGPQRGHQRQALEGEAVPGGAPERGQRSDRGGRGEVQAARQAEEQVRGHHRRPGGAPPQRAAGTVWPRIVNSTPPTPPPVFVCLLYYMYNMASACSPPPPFLFVVLYV